jgi:hypothetical protein
MTSRERVFAALEFRRPDVVPLECTFSAAGLYEHGELLRGLWRACPQDFDDFTALPIPAPPTRDLDAEGRYHGFETDAWGVVWEERIFGVCGHPHARPLDDLAALATFTAPALPSQHGPEFARVRQEAAAHRERYVLKSGWISIFGVMHALRRMEDVLAELALGAPEIARLADIITGYQAGAIDYLLHRGVDAIQFGDDFGTGSGLMFSPELWRRFFRPRYDRLMEPIRRAGVRIFFHSCGHTLPLLEDLRELGVCALWPQLTACDCGLLAERCRALRLAVQVDIARLPVIGRGTPADVRRAVNEMVGLFRMREGGSWFHVQIDDGYPAGNVRALFEAIGACRALR